MNKQKKVVYREFGADEPANEPEIRDLPPSQQNIKIQATRTGRKGKTVTVITGWQHSSENLTKLLKQIKTTCGSGGTIKDNTLEIQGEHKQKLLTFLTKLGYKVKISGG